MNQICRWVKTTVSRTLLYRCCLSRWHVTGHVIGHVIALCSKWFAKVWRVNILEVQVKVKVSDSDSVSHWSLDIISIYYFSVWRAAPLLSLFPASRCCGCCWPCDKYFCLPLYMRSIYTMLSNQRPSVHPFVHLRLVACIFVCVCVCARARLKTIYVTKATLRWRPLLAQ